MALPVSSLSEICTAVADFVRSGLDAVANNIDVSVGIPAEASSTKHLVNLFFYRFEPSGMVLNTTPADPWRLRLHCLITPFAIAENSISSGENDLRLIGEVLRIFHENPVLGSCSINGEEIRLQVIYNPLTEDQVNQIWSTQGDTVYRPSVAYEMSLAPVMPETLNIGDPLVGAVGKSVAFNVTSRYDSFEGTAVSPPVMPLTVDISNPEWVPAICFVYDGTCCKSLSLDMESSGFASFKPEIWLAGDTASEVSIKWERWDSGGWQDSGTPVTATPFSESIDPETIPGVDDSFPLTLTLPSLSSSSESSAQFLLYAVRSVERYSGGPVIEVRSNPLLISLYRSA